MKKHVFLTFFIIFFINFVIFGAIFPQNSENIDFENSENLATGIVRYAIYVGANDGGKNREKLLYAGSDAQSLKNTMKEIGGVEEANSKILINPTKQNIDDAISNISEKITENANSVKRSEFLFYYSGHSDESGLLLGEAMYDYSELKAAITQVPSDIHVVILDSCYSGNFIRTKGGQKRKPFLVDDSAVVSGHAYLSSSLENEFSQESDEIESSYFTNAIINGLRGAADTSGDNKVTLNELYSYAFSETLSRTENSKAGPQHPNYNITLVGSGDLVLSDLSAAEAILSLSKETKGRFIIRDKNEKLVSEINKVPGQPIFMALPADEYFCVVINENSTKQGTFVLQKHQVFVIDENAFSSITRKNGRIRGNNSEKFFTDNSDILDIDDLNDSEKNQNFDEVVKKSDENENEFDINNVNFDNFNIIHIQPVPAVNIIGKAETTIFSLGLLGSIEKAIMLGPQISPIMNISPALKFGVQIAGLFNINTCGIASAQVGGLFNISKDFSGIQIGGLFNVANDMIGNQTSGLFNTSSDFKGLQIAGGANFSDNMNGVQISGFINIADNVNGIQATGFMNIADKVNGVQFGIINIADSVNGLTLGLFNFVNNGLMDISIAYNTDNLLDLYYQGGSKYFYSVIGIITENFFKNTFNFGASYVGLGTQLSLGILKFELEILSKFYYYNFKNAEYEKLTNTLQDLKNESFTKFLFALSVHALRVNAHIQFVKFFSIFASAIFDYHKNGINDAAFELYKRNLSFDFAENDKIFVNFQFGVRFHL